MSIGNRLEYYTGTVTKISKLDLMGFACNSTKNRRYYISIVPIEYFKRKVI